VTELWWAGFTSGAIIGFALGAGLVLAAVVAVAYLEHRERNR
jgi:hypothetical protein